MSSLHKEFELAEALERALAKRGSTPAVLDNDVAELVQLARTLQDTATRVAPSEEFRARSHQRLLMHMARSSRPRHSRRTSIAERARVWAIRVGAALASLSIAGAAAAGASASALPGDPLYPVKQVTESAVLQLAATDSARQDVLLHQADTRLDETARLVEQGRDADAAVTVARYDETLAALTAPATSAPVQSQLGSSEARLNRLLESAPPSARPGLQRALAATERSLNGGESTSPVADTAETAAPEPHQSQQPSELVHTERAAVRPSVPADSGEHSDARTPQGPADYHRHGLQHQPQPTLVAIEPDSPAAEASRNESDGLPAPDQSNPVPRAGAHAVRPTESAATPRANAQPGAVKPGRTAPERSGAPRPAPAPAGRGRPSRNPILSG
jgi:anti-sigma-K factor RskA